MTVCQSHKLFDFHGRAVGFGWGRHLPLPPTFPQAGFGHKKRFPVGSARTARALWGWHQCSLFSLLGNQ